MMNQIMINSNKFYISRIREDPMCIFNIEVNHPNEIANKIPQEISREQTKQICEAVKFAMDNGEGPSAGIMFAKRIIFENYKLPLLCVNVKNPPWNIKEQGSWQMFYKFESVK